MIRRPPRSTRTDTLFPYTTLFRSGNRLGQVELAADLVRRIEQRDVVAALGGDRRAGQARRARADHGDTPGRIGRRVFQPGLVAGARVDQAARTPVLEHVVQARLVESDERRVGTECVSTCRSRGLPLY